MSSSIDTADFDHKLSNARNTVGTRFDLVIRANSPIRRLWDVGFAVLISYIATFWLYRLCFVEIQHDVSHQPSRMSKSIDMVIDIFFWIDLFANFLFSYTDRFGHEVCNLKMIAINYLCGFFIPNLLACIPPQLVVLIIRSSSVQGTQVNGMARLVRVQRASKLARFVRVGRLTALASLKGRVMSIIAPNWQTTPDAIRVRTLRVVNLGFSLLWTVHVLACGWQACAVLSDDINATWLGRRDIQDAEPVMQWANACYFILTVFTTVGFGDISAVTTPEIGYICVCMLIGAVVHSILVSEVISVVTQVDKGRACIKANIDLVEAFAYHAGLDMATRTLLREWVASHAAGWVNDDYDVDGMTTLISRRHMPGWLMDKMSSNMFGGLLHGSSLSRLFSEIGQASQAKVSLTLALSSFRNNYSRNDIVYKRFQKPVSLYCVLSGTVSYVGTPDVAGGTDYPPHESIAHITSEWHVPHMEDTIESAAHSNHRARPFSPYMTFSRGACFGLIETILSGTERKCTASVESEMAEVLCIPHDKFSQLVEDFPSISKAVKSAARFAEMVRLLRLERLIEPVTYLALAATSIQRFWRCRGMVKDCCVKRDPPPCEVFPGGVVVELGAQHEQSQTLSLMEEVKELRDALTSVESKVEVGLRELPSQIMADLLSKLKRSEPTALELR